MKHMGVASADSGGDDGRGNVARKKKTPTKKE